MALVINDQPHIARLTLGALAELEAGMGEDTLLALVERFEGSRFSSRDVGMLLGAGLRGAGHQISDAELMQANIQGGPMAAARAAAELLARAFVVPE